MFLVIWTGRTDYFLKQIWNFSNERFTILPLFINAVEKYVYIKKTYSDKFKRKKRLLNYSLYFLMNFWYYNTHNKYILNKIGLNNFFFTLMPLFWEINIFTNRNRSASVTLKKNTVLFWYRLKTCTYNAFKELHIFHNKCYRPIYFILN